MSVCDSLWLSVVSDIPGGVAGLRLVPKSADSRMTGWRGRGGNRCGVENRAQDLTALRRWVWGACPAGRCPTVVGAGTVRRSGIRGEVSAVLVLLGLGRVWRFAVGEGCVGRSGRVRVSRRVRLARRAARVGRLVRRTRLTSPSTV
jgi:hypothetical protein